ncbi:hypothetical protein HERIO_2717 [Hepatospora eriocheir]|uniref:Uncharacterized protein n=1 Tax=Hepatospora eriocheir TaxID=1081669 RepID=A0A1X0QBI9_9MICR|nr:hypothetical protein HERIO_2717 [Hepatospora eriocheir]
MSYYLNFILSLVVWRFVEAESTVTAVFYKQIVVQNLLPSARELELMNLCSYMITI